MELYGHKTNGGAQYYSTTYVECPNGHKEGTIEGTAIRTDNDELEIANYKQLLKAGFKVLVLPNGDRIDIIEQL